MDRSNVSLSKSDEKLRAEKNITGDCAPIMGLIGGALSMSNRKGLLSDAPTMGVNVI